MLLGLVETPSGVNTRSFLSVEYPKRQSTLYVVVYRLFKQELVIDVDIVSVALGLALTAVQSDDFFDTRIAVNADVIELHFKLVKRRCSEVTVHLIFIGRKLVGWLCAGHSTTEIRSVKLIN